MTAPSATSHSGDRYEVSLLWKQSLPDNYSLCRQRLLGLLRHMRRNPTLLQDHNHIIQEQSDMGIVEDTPTSEP